MSLATSLMVGASRKNLNPISETVAFQGRILFPATGYLYVVWKEMAELRGLTPGEARVIFENVRFKRATPLTPTSVVELLVTIFEESGYFEVSNEKRTPSVEGCIKNYARSTRVVLIL